MSDDASPAKSPMWNPWFSWMEGSIPNPLDVFAPPRNLDQPILPNWFSVNVTNQNSSAPDTERQVVAAHSYGRQLGRIMDVIACLIDESPKAERRAKAFEEFNKLRDDIDRIKSQAAERRVDRIASDLATLKETNLDEYNHIVAKLRELLA